MSRYVVKGMFASQDEAIIALTNMMDAGAEKVAIFDVGSAPPPPLKAERPRKVKPKPKPKEPPQSEPEVETESEYDDPATRATTPMDTHRKRTIARIRKEDGTRYSTCEALMKLLQGRVRMVSVEKLMPLMEPYGTGTRSHVVSALTTLEGLGFVKNEGGRCISLKDDYRELPKAERLGSDGTIHDFVIDHAKANPEFTLLDAQRWLYDAGWCPTGAHPALSNLKQAGCVSKHKGKKMRHHYLFIKRPPYRLDYETLEKLRTGELT